MALTYRSPVEEVLTSFTAAEQSAIAISALAGFKDLEAQNYEHFHYALNATCKQKLIGAGIYLSPFSAEPHSHPACKTLENYFLYKVLPSYLDHHFYFVGIKLNKLNFLKKRKKNLQLCEVINRYVSSRDKFRYSSDFVVNSSVTCLDSLRGHVQSFRPELKSLLPAAIKQKNRKLFLHDELHYWSKESLGIFLEEVRPEVLLATVVIPPETLIGAESSMNKWCYDFEVKGTDLFFFPDGVCSEGYVQPLSSNYLLKTNRLVTLSGEVYNVDILCSKFSHHLIAISRGDLITPKFTSFSDFDAISAKFIQPIAVKPDQCYPISFTTISKIHTYLCSLNSPDVKSAVAKLRQLVHEPTAFEVGFVIEFATLFIKIGADSNLLLPDIWRSFKYSFLKMMPGIIARNSKTFIKGTLSDFVNNLCPLRISVENETIDFQRGTEESRADQLVCKFIRNLKRQWERRIGSWLYRNDRINQKYDLVDIGEVDLIPKGWMNRLMVNWLIQAYDFNALMDLDVEGTWKWIVGRFQAVQLRVYVNPPTLDQFDDCVIKAMEFLKLQAYWESKSKKQKYLRFYEETDVRPKGVAILEIGEEKVSEMGRVCSEEFKLKPCTEGRQTFITCECGCGLEICMKAVLGVGDCRPSFPDRLRNRQACFYSKGAFDYSYNGGNHKGQEWPQWLDMLLELNGVGLGYYDCVLVQKYDAGGSIGFHADDEELFVAGGKILTFSTGGACTFDFKCNVGSTTIVMPPDFGFEMPEGFQLDHKHRVRDCEEGRISYTFRRSVHGDRGTIIRNPAPTTMPEEQEPESEHNSDSTDSVVVEYCDELGVEISITSLEDDDSWRTIEVPGDGNCFWHSIGYFLGVEGILLKKITADRLEVEVELPDDYGLNGQMTGFNFAESEGIAACALLHSLEIIVLSADQHCVWRFIAPEAKMQVYIVHKGEHFEPALKKNDCVAVAIAESLNRSLPDIYRVLLSSKEPEIMQNLMIGEGFDIMNLERIFDLFGIRAMVEFEGLNYELCAENEILCYYQIIDGHMVNAARKPRGRYCSGVTPLKLKKGDLALKAFKEAGSILHYPVSPVRAEILNESLYKASTGVLSSGLFNGASKLVIPTQEEFNREVCAILGTFGAGKTTLFKNYARSSGERKVVYVSPRKALADALKESLGLGNKRNENPRDRKDKNKSKWRVLTFETFLLNLAGVREGDCVIIDEIQLYPPGYLDLCLIKIPARVEVIVLGDPCQSDYDSEKDRHIFADKESDVDRLLTGQSYKFCSHSRRFKNSIFKGRLPCTLRENDFTIDEPYVMVHGLDQHKDIPFEFREVILVSSFIEKNIAKSLFGSKAQILTFGESTGQTFNRGTILITQSSLAVSEKRWVTALSRFSMNLCLFNLLEGDFEMVARGCADRMLGKFLLGKAGLDDLTNFLKGNPKFVSSFTEKIGWNKGVREEKLQGDPWLKSELFLGQEEDVQVVELAKEVENHEWFKTHLPKWELEGLRAGWAERILAKEDREFKHKDLVTEQFTEEHSKNRGKVLTNQAERFETIYPRHKASDTLTFLMAVKKRLRFSKPHVETAKLREAEPYGEFLLQEFLKKIPLRPQHRSDLMTDALRDFEEKKTSKSGATIENHAGRSCKDWLIDVGLVFSKSQICTKWDNRFRMAKAAQTIVCFQHSVLCRFAPYMRYIEKKVNEVLPKNLYIHSGKGLDELNEWVKSGNFTSTCTESDYEAFDASQDHYIMAFELALMKFLGLPKDLIADYVFIKTHLGCKLGAFAIMRFSGEASTFLFNTLANILFTSLRYELNGKEFICFAGDDMCASKRLPLKTEHENFLGKLKLKAKVDFTKRPTFCGWNLTHFGIYKKPQLVIERMCIAKETNNLKNCIDNYAIEVSFAYKLGELAVNHMNEEELEAFYNCVRVIIKSLHLMRSDVVNVFRNKS